MLTKDSYKGNYYAKKNAVMYDLQNGDTSKARDWLNKNIYFHASTNKPEKIIENAIRKKPNEEPLSSYLKNKFN